MIEYIGDGNYLYGVPARDMELSEWEALPEKDRELALSLGLYQPLIVEVPVQEPVKEE